MKFGIEVTSPCKKLENFDFIIELSKLKVTEILWYHVILATKKMIEVHMNLNCGGKRKPFRHANSNVER